MILVELDTPNGPRVTYGPDDDVESVEVEIPPGLIVDWSNSCRTTAHRYAAPLVHAPHACDADCAAFLVDGQCGACGVSHTNPCPTCGGAGYHHAGCPWQQE